LPDATLVKEVLLVPRLAQPVKTLVLVL
jgi:hypothetical protein